MKTITCIVIDNEPDALINLVKQLRQIPHLYILKTFDKALDAISMISSGQVDLVLCELQMPDIDGLSLLKSIKKPTLFIFVTADPTQAILSYELGVLDYIMKPFSADRLHKAISKAHTLLDSKKTNKPDRDFLIIKDRTLNIIMPYNEIFFLKSDSDYVNIATKEKNYTVCKRLTEFEQELSSAQQFLRVQRSYIVNLDFAKTIDGNLIEMRGHIEVVPIGGKYRAELYTRLGITSTD